jgi:prevent-host-death family protein
VESIPVSKFKATCLAVIERVQRTGEPVLITNSGAPVAQLVPPPPPSRPRSAFGALRGTVEYLGDIVEPLGEAEWEAAR